MLVIDCDPETDLCEAGRVSGVVTEWDEARGFGFVAPTDTSSPVAYVHWRNLPYEGTTGRRSLTRGTKVTYIESDVDSYIDRNNTLFAKVVGNREVKAARKVVFAGKTPEGKARDVNYVGVRSILHHLQNVRHVDYEEASKRCIFRFEARAGQEQQRDVDKVRLSRDAAKY